MALLRVVMSDVIVDYKSLAAGRAFTNLLCSNI